MALLQKEPLTCNLRHPIHFRHPVPIWRTAPLLCVPIVIVHTHTHMHTRGRTRTHIHTHTHTHTHTHAQTRTQAHLHIYVYMHTCVCIHTNEPLMTKSFFSCVPIVISPDACCNVLQHLTLIWIAKRCKCVHIQGQLLFMCARSNK